MEINYDNYDEDEEEIKNKKYKKKTDNGNGNSNGNTKISDFNGQSDTNANPSIYNIFKIYGLKTEADLFER